MIQTTINRNKTRTNFPYLATYNKGNEILLVCGHFDRDGVSYIKATVLSCADERSIGFQYNEYINLKIKTDEITIFNGNITLSNK